LPVGSLIADASGMENLNSFIKHELEEVYKMAVLNSSHPETGVRIVVGECFSS